MSDYNLGRITFGGKLKKSLVPELKRILDDHFRDRYNMKRINKDFKRKKPIPLTYQDDNAEFGHFEELEVFCRKNGLTYNTFASGNEDFLPEVRFYSPELGEEQYSTCDPTGNTIAEKSLVIKILKAAQVLCNDLTKVPLLVNDESDPLAQRVAKKIAQTGITDPIEIAIKCIDDYTGEPCEVPPMEIID